MLKKSVLVVALLLIATNLWAVPPPLDVSQSRHNFGSTSGWGDGTYRAVNEDEVCIYCHTPHGGSVAVPLWNRASATMQTPGGFTHYASATLSGYMTGGTMATRNVNIESLLCMSCHDGTAAINNIHNISNRTGEFPDGGGSFGQPGWDNHIITMFGIPGASIGDASDGAGGMSITNPGKDLSDDHPISFSYYAASTHADNNGKLRLADGDINTDPRKKGIRLFGDPNSEQRVECSSCHDPHVNYEGLGGDIAYAPFLVMSNNGSALCLACHIK